MLIDLHYFFMVSNIWQSLYHLKKLLLTGVFVFSVTGYGFLQPAQAEIFARQQEMLRKQNLARCVCLKALQF